MSFKRHSGGVWTDIENVKRYSGGAWQDCESVKKYSGGAWVAVWENTPSFKFGWVYNDNPNGPLPTYIYEPNGNSCHVKLTRGDSVVARSDIILPIKIKLEAGSSCTMSLQLSNCSTNVTSAHCSFVFNQSNNNGLWQTVNIFGLTNGVKQYTWTIPDGGVNSINLVIQVEGNASAYVEFDISNVVLNGVTYGFR